MKKRPILPNNFNSESKSPETDAKHARSVPETAPNDAQTALRNAPSPSLSLSEGEGSRVREASPAVGAHGDAPSPATPDIVGAPREAPSPKSKRGPKTKAGKQRVSRNAVKHGIRSPHPFIIEGLESPEEWEELKLGIIESWQPVGMQELELAINVAWNHLKLRRCRLVENAQISKQVEETEWELQREDALEDDLPDGAPLPAIEPERLIHHQHLRLIPGGWSMDPMFRNEAFVRKALSQDMRELEVLQARRQGERPPLAARVVFSSDPSAVKVHMSANDIPEFQIARERVRLAKLGLAERKRAARAEKHAPEPALERQRRERSEGAGR